jgi:hypothetical protein
VTIEQIDSTLKRLRDAAEAIRSNLVEVELDDVRKLLDSSALAGESAVRWREANASLAELWRWHGLLQQLLDRAGRLRGTRARPPAKRLEELSDLLQGASIEPSSEPPPLPQRDLLAGVERVSADELLERCSAAFDQVKAVLVAVGSAWSAFEPRLRAARATLEESLELAHSLGEGSPPELDAARARLDELAERLSKDPLSVSEGDLAEAERSLHAVGADLEGLERVRQEMATRLSDARRLLEELRDTAREGSQTHRQVLAKIVAPAVPDPLRLNGALESQLDDVANIARHGAWREARTLLEQWSTRAQSLLQQARSIAHENSAPIQARNELRGLLDAYQAKAARFGLIEDSRLSGTFEQARDTLYSAPTDLAAAGELVDRYRQTLGELAPSRELRR